MFHTFTQERWVDDIETIEENVSRDERLDDTEARRISMLLQIQLKQAISDSLDQEEHTLNALRTYKTYQKTAQADYEASKIFDRLEVLLSDDNPAYRSEGLVGEGYNIGGFSGVLLDMDAIRKKEDPNEWKRKIEKNKGESPITLLEKVYKGQDLPEQVEIPTEKEYVKGSETMKLSIPLHQKRPLFLMFFMVYYISLPVQV